MFPMHNETAMSLLSLLFFAKKLRIMHEFFQRCQEMAAVLNGEFISNAVSCFVIVAAAIYSCVILYVSGFMHVCALCTVLMMMLVVTVVMLVVGPVGSGGWCWQWQWC